MDKKRLPFPMVAARLSLFTPLVLFVIGLAIRACVPNPKSRELEMVIGVSNLILILGALILGIISLACIPRYGRKGILGYACSGIVLNGIILGACVLLFFAVRRVAEVFNAGYTVEEMRSMSEVVPNSYKILNDAIGFRCELPEGFQENPEGAQSEAILYSLIKLRDDGAVFAVNIERLGGRIGKESIQPEHFGVLKQMLPPGAKVEKFQAPWKDYMLDGFSMTYEVNKLPMATYTIQVPLAREAIQVNAAAPADHSSECRELLHGILRSLRGISNWRTLPDN
jgi:hypothetical protein